MLGFIEIAIPHGGLFLTLGIIFGFYMAWSIGANDVANAMGTSGEDAEVLRAGEIRSYFEVFDLPRSKAPTYFRLLLAAD